MFICAQGNCDTQKFRRPGERPIKRVLSVRTVDYVHGVEIVGVGEEIAREVDVCWVCHEILGPPVPAKAGHVKRRVG